MNVEAFFSALFAEARDKFCSAADAAGAELVRFEHPLQGPGGEPLSTDVALLGPTDASRVLICTSATHGAEGFCGSGAQVGVMSSGLLKHLPEDIALVLVHALNPHGFAWQRRVTEDNVDLNRNFVDFSQPLPGNEAYAEVHDMLLPTDWDGDAKRDADRTLQGFVHQHGLPAFQSAVSAGQHTHPDGMFFGGTKPTWSNATWRNILRRHGHGRRHIALIDFHTGLGPTGYGEPISGSEDMERLRHWYGPEVTSTSDGSSSSAQLTGRMSTAISEEAPDAEITAMTLEFGTLPLLQVIEALRADHWLHCRADAQHPLAAQIKQQIRSAFYIETPQWKQQVWERSREMVSKAFAGLSHA